LGEELLLSGGEGFMRGGRGHELGAGGFDALDDEGVFGVAGDDGGTGAAGRGGFVSQIEAETGHAGALVGAVAAEAGVGEDGADIAVETYFRVKGEAEEGEQPETTHGETMI
jgi:hypothetical protein